MLSTGGTTTIGLYDFKRKTDTFGGVDYWEALQGGYLLNARVMLANGDIVKSTIANNIINPDIDMTGWVKVGGLIIVNTVAEMISKKLKNGDVVKTLGYNNLSDNGGAFYVISNTATDYSIPLSNGNHAVFNDDFDIRKFGIRNNGVLDQTTELTRMVNYADSRVYEIDFHNFHIMTPKIPVPYRGNASLGQGMAFKFVHKLKNLKISNDKTVQLQQGYCCIWFNPSVDGVGIFKLDNIIFDPYVADYKITAGDGDGHMHGFTAEWSRDFPIGWPASQQFMTGYSIEYNNINFISPAISYNLATDFWCKKQTATNMFGEYWGLYLWHWCNDLYAENVHGVFRDDLHTVSGRTLVTNLFQEEQEVGSTGFVYSQSSQKFTNISSIKKSDGSYYSSIARQEKGSSTLNRLVLDNVRGGVQWYMGEPAVLSTKISINTVLIKNCNTSRIVFWCGVDSLEMYDSTVVSQYLVGYKYTINKVLFDNVIINSDTTAFAGCTIHSFKGVNCTFNNPYGLSYGAVAIQDLTLINPTWLVGADGGLLTLITSSVYISGGRVLRGALNYFVKLINIVDDGITTPVNVTISNLNFDIGGGDGGYLVFANGGKVVNAIIRSNGFKAKPNFVLGAGGTLSYEYNSPILSASKTYDPPSLGAGLIQSTTLTLNGAIVGDNVTCSFNQPLLGTRMWSEVTTNNMVTVYQQNPTTTAIDVASGTLTVKVI